MSIYPLLHTTTTMKFVCTKENLFSSLALTARAANKTTSLPILSNILLRATKAGLELTATNLEVAVVTTLRGRVEKEGAVAVNARLITEAVSFFPNNQVELDLEGTTLTLRCGKHRTIIRGVVTDDFPVIPEVVGGSEFIVSSLELKRALERVEFAINPDENRPEIAGVYFSAQANKLVVVGTDSYRLAESTTSQVKGSGTKQFIVPLRAAQEVVRVLDNTDEEVKLVVTENQVAWFVGDSKVVSRLVAGQYPDYQQIIPREFSTNVVVGREEFVRAVRAASLFVRAGINDVKLSLDPGQGLMKISSANSQLGENMDELEIKGGGGQPNEIVFNYQYLLDGLQAVGTNQVILEVVNPNSPGVVRPDKEEGYLYIIMPIRQ
ncbi:MAG: DNA polymerase III subunit beta [Candidatus Kerfeldbacteria bacterium]|nr:DNA polymerase III subunit beta [Candidatus Kerfeldbacteria bacterium]